MTAFYLKYRPQTLDELIGQTQVKNILNAAYSSQRLSHAYLFAGPRGTGKTSTARILAKMVNCSTEQNTPCNKCETCISITDGSNLDLIEIDAASNRGIDDIRALRETIKLAPSGSKKKVYIIDEVHMLTTEAFNALLKTLEEPPQHALFILATTEIQKVPQTILSRVTRLDFKLASQSELIEALRKIVDSEKIKIDGELLKLIAKKADGSFRDGVKLLDQLSSSGKEIRQKDVEEIGTGNFDITVEFLDIISEKKSKEALLLIIKQLELGRQLKDFTFYTMDILRDLIFIKNDLGLQLVKEEIGSDGYQKLEELAGKFSIKDIILDLDIFQEALEKMKIASIPSLPMELAVVEICGEELSVISLPARSIGSRRAGKAGHQSSEREKLDKPPNLSSNLQHPTSNVDLSKLSDRWTFVLETIRQNNFSLEALLRSAKIVEYSGGIVLIEVPYAFHQRILEQPKSKNLLEAILSDVLSEPVKVSTVLGNRPQRIEDIANIELAPEDEIITLAADIFNGKLVD